MKRLKPLPRNQQNLHPAAHEAVPPAADLPRSKSNRVHDSSRTNLALNLAEDPKPVEEKKEDDKPAEEEKKDCAEPAEEAKAAEEKADTAQRKLQQYTAAACTWPSDDQIRTFQQCALSSKEQQIALHEKVAELKRLGLIDKEEEKELYRLIHQRDPDIMSAIMENAGISKADATGEADSSGKDEERQQVDARRKLAEKKLKVALEKHSATAPAADVKPFLSYRLQFNIHLEQNNSKRTIKGNSAHILQVPAPTTVEKDRFKENLFNIHLVRYFVENVWKLDQPDVIISITGGAQNFDLPPEHKDRMMRGMMEGTRQMKPWSVSAFTSVFLFPFVGA
jgi:hypothetical protein